MTITNSKAILFLLASFALSASASDGYQITGQTGVMSFVAVETAQRDNEDVYRLAVASACAGKQVCQVHFWAGSAPNKFPLTDSQMESKLVHWQQNLNSGVRRWLVNCGSTDLFASSRECM